MWHILFCIFSINNGLTENVKVTLISKRFQGYWESSISQPFNYLESESGETQIAFHYTASQLAMNISENIEITSIQLIFLDPKYYDERVVAGIFNVTNFNEDTKLSLFYASQWIGETNLTFLKFYKEREYEANVTCLVDYAVDLQISDKVEDLQFTIDLGTSEEEKNPDCQNIDFVSAYSQDVTNLQGQILFYSILLNTVCAIQYFSVSRLTESLLNDDDNNSQRISIFCVGFVTIYDTYIAFQNLNFAFRTAVNFIKIQYFQYFIVPAIFFFMLTMNCDLKLLWIVCRTRFYEHFQDPFRQRQFLARFFILYYVSVLGIFLLLQQYELYNSFLLIIGFFITPQIIHNFKEGTNPRFIPEYIFGFLLVNITVPLYFRGNPSNFRKLKPSWEFCVSWILIYLIQISILYFQYIYGPRKIIPKCLLPKQYNYYQPYKPQEAEECAICLLNLMIEPEQQDQDLDRMLVSKILMVTPCGHKFHPSCLRGWMDVKLSCPTCRNGIPPDYQ